MFNWRSRRRTWDFCFLFLVKSKKWILEGNLHKITPLALFTLIPLKSRRKPKNSAMEKCLGGDAWLWKTANKAKSIIKRVSKIGKIKQFMKSSSQRSIMKNQKRKFISIKVSMTLKDHSEEWVSKIKRNYFSE